MRFALLGEICQKVSRAVINVIILSDFNENYSHEYSACKELKSFPSQLAHSAVLIFDSLQPGMVRLFTPSLRWYQVIQLGDGGKCV